MDGTLSKWISTLWIDVWSIMEKINFEIIKAKKLYSILFFKLYFAVISLKFFNFKLFDEKIAIVPGWANWLCRPGRNCWSNLDLEGGAAWLSKSNKSFWFICVWFFNISICILKIINKNKDKILAFFCYLFQKSCDKNFKWKISNFFCIILNPDYFFQFEL